GVLVVGAGQALVRRDDQAGIGPALDVVLMGRVEVPAVDVAGSAEDPLDLGLQRLEVGAGVFQVRPGAAQLGGGDQVHGVGDLLGLADALDPVFDLFGAWHITAPSSDTGPRRCGPGRGSAGGRPRSAGRWSRSAGTGRRPARRTSPASGAARR